MLYSQMIANQNPAPFAPPGLPFPLFFDSSPSGNHNSRVFCDLRTLRAHLSPKIASNSFHVIALRTLAKTTEGYHAKPASNISSFTFSFDSRFVFSGLRGEAVLADFGLLGATRKTLLQGRPRGSHAGHAGVSNELAHMFVGVHDNAEVHAVDGRVAVGDVDLAVEVFFRSDTEMSLLH